VHLDLDAVARFPNGSLQHRIGTELRPGFTDRTGATRDLGGRRTRDDAHAARRTQLRRERFRHAVRVIRHVAVAGRIPERKHGERR
jgi:hypothetical protein